MHNLRKFYYNNKTKIWRSVFIIVFCIALIQVLNYMSKVSSQEKLQQGIIDYVENVNGLNTTKDSSYLESNKSIISGETIDNNTLQKIIDTINLFINYCNDNEIEKAYDLLSEDCKNVLYTSKEDFKQRYVDNIFSGKIKKVASVENWSGNIYKVNIKEDIMATGNVSKESTQEYITIVIQDDDIKLNINSFIEKQNINKSTIHENITITVLSKIVFMDYEKYTLRIDNGTDNTILLDSLESTKTIYVLDNKEKEYYSYTNEILTGLLRVNGGFSTQIDIKFYKTYSESRTSKKIVFSNLIMNYDEYLNGYKKGTLFTVEL